MEALFIESDRVLKEGMDFKTLRAQGVRLLQKYAGKFWSDYNEHDPGITILEQLCYALTELSYRADFSVADLLVDKKGEINEDEQLLYSADEVLPAQALTINDYRKVIFDEIIEVRNVWIEPMFSQSNMLRGLYQILLDVSEYHQNQIETIKHRVYEIFSQNRNLGEDVEQIIVLDFLPISIHASIEVNEENDLESILAEIYYHVRYYFSPEPKFYSLEKLLEEGKDYNQIFSGVLLKHGFIKDSSLQDRIKLVLISDLVKLLMKIKGISNVKNLVLKAENQSSNSEIILPPNTLPKLDTSEEGSISFSKSGIAYRPDRKIVESKLQDLIAINQRIHHSSSPRMDLPKGNVHDFAQYYSIQNDFPLIYGINQLGLPESESNERKAQAKQLKGYLLVFEQVMANYFNQLAHLRDLFSIRDIRKTYFFQPLKDIPSVSELYKNDHELQLEKLNDWQDDFLKRRHQFLDYMLAAYGESFTQYSVSKFNPYLSKEEFDEYLLENKLIFLRFIRTINKNRGRSQDYSKTIFDPNVVSGLEIKMMILLGIRKGLKFKDEQWVYEEYSTLEEFENYGLKIGEESLFDASELDATLIDQKFEFIFEQHQFDKKLSDQENKKILEEINLLKKQSITEYFLREGLKIGNYKIGKIDDKTVAVFKSKDQWLHIGQFEDETQAINSIFALRNMLRNINQGSEGLQLFEHILLRPDFNSQKFGFDFREKDNVLLEFPKLYDFNARAELINKIYRYLPAKEKYIVEKSSDRECYIVFQHETDFILRGKNVFKTVFEARARIDQICKYFSANSNNLLDALFLYVQWSENSPKIPESFYSFKLSVFFPSWTARFVDIEFRSLVEETLAFNVPANLLVENCAWLSPSQMADYEQLYYDWAREKKLPKAEQTQIEKLDFEMTMWLIDFKKNNKSSNE